MDNEELHKYIRSKVEDVHKESALGAVASDTISWAVNDIILAINLNAVASATNDEMIRAMGELRRKGGDTTTYREVGATIREQRWERARQEHDHLIEIRKDSAYE